MHENIWPPFLAFSAIISIGPLSPMLNSPGTPRSHGIQAVPGASILPGKIFAQYRVNYQLLLSMIISQKPMTSPVHYDIYGKESKPCIIPYSYKVHLQTVCSNGSILTSIEIHTLLPSLSCSDLIKSCSIMWTRLIS